MNYPQDAYSHGTPPWEQVDAPPDEYYLHVKHKGGIIKVFGELRKDDEGCYYSVTSAHWAFSEDFDVELTLQEEEKYSQLIWDDMISWL